MKHTFILIAIILVAIFSSCNKEELHGRRSKSFVTGYCFPSGITITKTDSTGIRFRFDGNLIHSGEVFDRLSEKHGDVSYNACHGHTGPCNCLYSGLVSVKVETMSDFDSVHPAGSDVSDLMECAYCTVYEFIQNGYKCFEENASLSWDYGFHQLERYHLNINKLSEINGNNTKLLSCGDLLLLFKTFPDSPGDYMFRLSIMIDGRILEKRFSYQFS